MSDATDEKRVDEARGALVDDIRELKSAGAAALQKGESKLPWVLGGAAGLVMMGLGVRALRPRRSALFVSPQPSFLGKALRAAALAATGILVRHYVRKIVDRALPEQEPNQAPTSAA